MPDIPSLGINTTNVVDPGVVNVEIQAYPRPLDLAQALARNLAALTAGSAFAANPPPPGSQAAPRPTEVLVAGLPNILPSLSLGVPFFDPPEVDVGAQNVIRQPVAEYLVTDVGSFQFNSSVQTSVRRQIAAVTSFVVISPAGVTTTFYVITFVAGTNLMDFGVDLVDTEALFPNSAPVLNPQAVPAGIITKFTNLQIVVNGTDLALDPPVAGDDVDLDVTRHGPDAVFDLFPNDVNVFIDSVQSASAAVTTVAASNPVVNAFANDGVRTPFVGAGTRIPLLLYLDLRETAFFPADQTGRGLGLPANVNIG